MRVKQSFWFRLYVLILRFGSYLFPLACAKQAVKIFIHPQRVPRPQSEEGFFESARKTRVAGGLAAYEWGANSGETIVLLHGWNGRGTQLGAFAKPFVEKGFRVIAIDGPAHGDSPGQEAHPGNFAQSLLLLQEEIGPFKAVISHSFGVGATALSVLRGLQTKKLVLIAGPAKTTVVVENFLKFLGLSEKANDYFRKLMAAKAGIAAEDLDFTRFGPRMDIPLMVVHDEDDNEMRFVSAGMIHEAWPNSELLTTKGLGHRRILKDPEVIFRVSEFIINP